MPRLTSSQITAIPAPAQGLLVYNTDSSLFQYFDETWKIIPNKWSDLAGTPPDISLFNNDAEYFKASDAVWKHNNNLAYLQNKADLVGIGTDTPQKTLHLTSADSLPTYGLRAMYLRCSYH